MPSITELPQYQSGRIPPDLLALLPPELQFGTTGRTVAREDVQALDPDDRRKLWFDALGDDGQGTRTVFPFYDDTGVHGLGPVDALPKFMRRLTLRTKHGMTDNQLEKQRQKVFGDRGPGELALSDDEPETIALQEERWRVWDAILAKAYADQGGA